MMGSLEGRSNAPRDRVVEGRLTPEQATARARAFDKANGRHQRRRKEKEAAAVNYQPWELDRSLLPKKPPGGRP
jgi:hypothetical protein